MVEITLSKGDRVTFVPANREAADRTIEPIPVSRVNRNLFGLSGKTTRLPGHQHYYKK